MPANELAIFVIFSVLDKFLKMSVFNRLPGLSHISHLDKKDLVLIQIVVNALQLH
jgi:hypothetical protein